METPGEHSSLYPLIPAQVGTQRLKHSHGACKGPQQVLYVFVMADSLVLTTVRAGLSLTLSPPLGTFD